MKKQTDHQGALLVAISAVSFGLMPTFAKMAYGAGASTYTLLLLRFAAAAAFMFVLTRIKGLPLPTGRQAAVFFLMGAVGYVGQSLSYFTALNHASSSVVVLLFYTNPALVMLISALFLHERVTARKLLALALAMLGAFVIAGSELNANPLGILFSVLSAVIYSVYIVVSSRVIPRGMSIHSSAFIMLGSAVVYGILNCFTGFTPPSNGEGYLAVALMALVSTVLAFWSFFRGMERTGPTAAALISTLEPVVTVLASVVVLGEPITAKILLGGCLVMAGLLVTALAPGEQESTEE